MPAVEGEFHTYANSTKAEDLIASRGYRVFGGFSLGSVTTWLEFCYDYDYIKYFLPISYLQYLRVNFFAGDLDLRICFLRGQFVDLIMLVLVNYNYRKIFGDLLSCKHNLLFNAEKI